MKSGFVAIIGRPNAGKSTLLNRMLEKKVSIVSPKAQTTRMQVRGVLHEHDAQIVFVDTPGIHKPRTQLGQRLNDQAYTALDGVDVILHVVDVTKPVGSGDEFVASKTDGSVIVVLNKIDRVELPALLPIMKKVASFGAQATIPVSASTGDGVAELVAAIRERLPQGPAYYPDDMFTDTPEATWVAELVREQLLAVLEEEMPHSVATIVTEWEWPRIRCEILVERDSQKGIVIGKNGAVLKSVGERVREQLAPGAYIELFVKVEKNWQRQPKSLDKLGY